VHANEHNRIIWIKCVLSDINANSAQCEVEVCTGMGISHENKSSFWTTNGNRNKCGNWNQSINQSQNY